MLRAPQAVSFLHSVFGWLFFVTISGIWASGSFFMSRLSPLANKDGDKRLQSALKVSIKKYGEILLQWKEFENQIAQQIAYQINLVSTNRAIANSLSSRSACLYQVLLPEIRTGLESKLFSRLNVELCRSVNLVQELLKNMDGFVSALKLKADDCYRLVLDQPFSAFASGCTYDSSHVIELQDIAMMLSHELQRKIGIITNHTNDLVHKFETRCAYSNTTIGQVVRDTSSYSLVDHWRVEAFLLQNNITDD